VTPIAGKAFPQKIERENARWKELIDSAIRLE